jgi:hypothetical protein
VILTIALAATLVSQSDASAASDRAFALQGAWICEATDHTTTGTALFVAHTGGLSMEYEYQRGDATHRLDAEFSDDPHTGTWTLDEPLADLQHFRGTAGAWTSQLWTFDGAVYPPTPGSSMYDRMEPASVTFIAFGNDTFEMIRTQETGGQWVVHDPWTSAVMDDLCTRSHG